MSLGGLGLVHEVAHPGLSDLMLNSSFSSVHIVVVVMEGLW